MTRIAGVLQVFGLVSVTFGCVLVAVWLGLVVGGVSAVLLGVALERNADAGKPLREARDQG